MPYRLVYSLVGVVVQKGKGATSRRLEKGDGTATDGKSSAKPSGRANKNRPQEVSPLSAADVVWTRRGDLPRSNISK